MSKRNWIIIIVASVLVLCCVVGIIANSQGGSTTTTTTANTTKASPAATHAPTATPKPKAWVTTQTFTGNGSKKTAVFTVPSDWKIVWSCAPSSISLGQYNVIVSVYNSDSTDADISAVNTICQAGNTGDTTEEHQSGSVYLDVTSEAKWTIAVQFYQ